MPLSYRKKINVEHSKNMIHEKYPGFEIFTEEINGLTRVGFFTGHNLNFAFNTIMKS